jgi:hypothetical protein
VLAKITNRKANAVFVIVCSQHDRDILVAELIEPDWLQVSFGAEQPKKVKECHGDAQDDRDSTVPDDPFIDRQQHVVETEKVAREPITTPRRYIVMPHEKVSMP